MNPQIEAIIQKFLLGLGQENPNIPQTSAPSVAIPYTKEIGHKVGDMRLGKGSSQGEHYYPEAYDEYARGGAGFGELSSPFSIQQLLANPLRSDEVSRRNTEQNNLTFSLPKTRQDRPKAKK